MMEPTDLIPNSINSYIIMPKSQEVSFVHMQFDPSIHTYNSCVRFLSVLCSLYKDIFINNSTVCIILITIYIYIYIVGINTVGIFVFEFHIIANNQIGCGLKHCSTIQLPRYLLLLQLNYVLDYVVNCNNHK